MSIRLWAYTSGKMACILCLLGAVPSCTRQPHIPMQTYWKPELTYLLAQPYDRLYVQVDAVEGSEQQAGRLNELKRLLATYCDKPAGIQIVQTKPIPRRDVKGLTPDEIAGLHIDAPPTSDPQHTAYLYLLFFHNPSQLAGPLGSHTGGPYPCGICWNTACDRISDPVGREDALEHEAGHVLGLCKNRLHSDGMHCRNKPCLMWGIYSARPWAWWIGRPPEHQQLCSDCRHDLESAKKTDPADAHVGFCGPLIARQGHGYWVLYHPRAVILWLDAEIPSWKEAKERVLRGLLEKMGPKGYQGAFAWPEGQTDMAKVGDAIEQALKDHGPSVRAEARAAKDAMTKVISKVPVPIESQPSLLASATHSLPLPSRLRLMLTASTAAVLFLAARGD